MLYNVIDRRMREDFISEGYVDIREKEINNTNDLVNIARLFRDPRYETFRIIYCNDNKIVGYESISSKIPAYSSVFKTQNKKREIYLMQNRMKRLNANGYYLLHNHPSGKAKASKYDINLTGYISNRVEGFKSHIIINSGTYAYIEKESNTLFRVMNEIPIENYKKDKIDELLKNNSLYGVVIGSREDIVDIAYNIKHNKEYSILILADSSNKVRIMLDIPDNFFNNDTLNIENFLKNRLVENGADKVFLFTTNDKVAEKGKNLIKKNILMDCILYKEEIKKIIKAEDDKKSEFSNFFESRNTRTIRVCDLFEEYEGGKNMKTYNFKWVDFLSQGNTVKVTNKQEFNDFKRILEKLNLLDILRDSKEYEDWQHIAEINGKNPYIFCYEYSNSKGLTWYDNVEESKEWYDKEPYTISEIKEEILGKDECMLLTAKCFGCYNDKVVYDAMVKINGELENIGIIKRNDGKWYIDKIFVSPENTKSIIEQFQKNPPSLNIDEPSKSYNLLERIEESDNFNLKEFAMKVTELQDFYNVNDEYGNINIDEQAVNKVFDDFLKTLENSPEDIMNNLIELQNEYEPEDEQYNEISQVIGELKDMMYLDAVESNVIQIDNEKARISFDYDIAKNDFFIDITGIDGIKKESYKIEQNSLSADAQKIKLEFPKMDNKIEKALKEKNILEKENGNSFINIAKLKDYDKDGLKYFLSKYMTEEIGDKTQVNTAENEE